MPVTLLLCEGEAQSFDVRLLVSILRNVVGEIRPSGGKDGFPNLIKSHRRTTHRTCGISDGDFPRKPQNWALATTSQEWSYTFEKKSFGSDGAGVGRRSRITCSTRMSCSARMNGR